MAPKVTEQYKKQRRFEILTAARTVFSRKGYLQTTMQDVIEETGLSRGAVYDYFDNKSHLYRAVIENQDEEFWAQQEEIQNSRPIWPAIEKLMITPNRDYDENAPGEISANIEFVMDSKNDEEAMTWIYQRYARFVESFTQMFQLGVDVGEFHPTLPLDILVRFMISAMDGLHVGVMAAGPERTKAREQSEALKMFLLDNLQPSSDSGN